MTDRPILFSAPMVRALLAGTKTQTRRIIKPRKHASLFDGSWDDSYVLDPGNESWRQEEIRVTRGDRLWVRETWQGLTLGDYRPTKHDPCDVRYGATDPCADLDAEARGYPWRPSIFMPRFASRLTLTVTDVRVERLQDISEADAVAEGIDCVDNNFGNGPAYCDYLLGKLWDTAEWYRSPIDSYRSLWDSINGKGAWDANPWIVAYTFTVHHSNIDQTAKEAT